MSVDEAVLADEAKAILDGAGDPLPGMEKESKVAILGASTITDDDFVLGQRVEFRLVGYVTSVGDELVEKSGRRQAVKVKTTMITLVDADGEEE